MRVIFAVVSVLLFSAWMFGIVALGLSLDVGLTRSSLYQVLVAGAVFLAVYNVVARVILHRLARGKGKTR